MSTPIQAELQIVNTKIDEAKLSKHRSFVDFDKPWDTISNTEYY